jgi:hypothetical protein
MNILGKTMDSGWRHGRSVYPGDLYDFHLQFEIKFHFEISGCHRTEVGLSPNFGNDPTC